MLPQICSHVTDDQRREKRQTKEKYQHADDTDAELPHRAASYGAQKISSGATIKQTMPSRIAQDFLSIKHRTPDGLSGIFQGADMHRFEGRVQGGKQARRRRR